MGWTAPPTFTYAQAMTVDILNTYLRDNLNWLKTRPWTSAAISGTTTSAAFAAATASASLTSVGGNVVIVFQGYHSNTSASVSCGIDFAIDGARQGDATNGLQLFHTHSTATDNYPITTFFITSTPPSAASHTYEVYRKTASGTLTLTGTLYVVEWF